MLLSRLPSFLDEADATVLLGDGELHTKICESVSRCNAQERRKRRLPAVLVMYVVLGLSLFRHLAILDVLLELLNGLRSVRSVGLLRCPPAESSVSEARRRLGIAPLRALFEATAAVVNPPPTFHGRRVHAIDGIRFIVADTTANVREFGRPKSARGQTAYPVVLVVARADVYSHRVGAIHIMPHNGSERAAIPELVKGLGKSDLVLLDRGFPSANLLCDLNTQVDFLVRIGSKWKPEIVERLGDGDYLVRIEVKMPIGPGQPRPRSSSKTGPKPKYDTSFLVLRMIVYTCDGKGTLRLLTNMLAPSVPALELAKLYHERWEIELTIDEIKNHFSVGFHGSPDLCFRSKDPVGVKQQLYATFAVFNHTRTIIAEAASRHGLKPLQISFTRALNAIRRTLPLLVVLPPRKRQELVAQLYREIAERCRIRARRPRHYPRKVKIKMSDFQCKRRGDIQTIVDFVAQTTMVDPASNLVLSP